ncbi:putative protein kinase [Leptomonas seymouri]|uniref:non-specific serine/threonine protein kinase n=1 Tax=Leptomonas seymouri TaxID=5684 RepID=A0A0N0P2D3_LEPSE|nr:putative protein kinase [Leptomonas seymouri]|eukprot:KPI82819.1 putative protein kinase [Leptomonas seymouri]
MSNPDWMYFDDDDGSNGTPPTAADVHGDSAAEGRTPDGGDGDPPFFLREDAVASHGSLPSKAAAPATPTFLSGLPGPEGDTPEGSDALRLEAAGAANGAFRGPGTADAREGSTVMYADQPSAAFLHFDGDSGTSWSLHRVRILGKGNYGCATLYALDAATVGTPPPQPSPQRAVVVKDINVQTMLNPQMDMSAVQNELQVLRSTVGHPNLVQYVDALFDSRPANYPMCYVMMEYAAGGDLAALLERRGTATTSSSSSTAEALGGDPLSSSSCMIPEDLVAAYLIQTAVALHSLHTEYGILHRDVKPHNIFLLEDGVTVRLGDFGISMQLGRVGEKAKEACGSPYFMAPEIFEERPYDSAADVWSLGVVFYQLLTHQLPFTASSVAALGALVRRGHYARLSDASPATAAAKAATYSKELRGLVDSLLTVDPAARPTLRRVLRSRYLREHLQCVPASVLQARKPVVVRSAASPVSDRGRAAATVAAPQFAEESLYASVFGADAVADAVARATHPGVSPIVNRIVSV